MVPTAPRTRRDSVPAGFGAESAVLRHSARSLLVALLVAQGAFVAYLLASYGQSTVRGDLAAWSRFSATGWRPGDTAGNTAMALHVFVAVLVLAAGALQVMPWIRRHRPAVHRWSGRVYLLACLVGAVSGLLLVWGRGTVGDLPQHLAISINAVVICGCAIMAWRSARTRDLAAHERWAMRTLATANGVLYFRIFLALWLVIFRAPVGFDAHTFSGPFLTTLAFTAYVVGPLVVYEAYRAACRSRRPAIHQMVALFLFTVALSVGAGSAAAMAVLWLPKVVAA